MCLYEETWLRAIKEEPNGLDSDGTSTLVLELPGGKRAITGCNVLKWNVDVHMRQMERGHDC